MDRVDILSAGLIRFARGVNDTLKLAALLIADLAARGLFGMGRGKTRVM